MMGVEDSQATELTFQDIIEEIRTKFRANDTLNSTCFSCVPVKDAPNVANIQVNDVDNRMFGSVLVHYCDLSLYAQENY